MYLLILCMMVSTMVASDVQPDDTLPMFADRVNSLSEKEILNIDDLLVKNSFWNNVQSVAQGFVSSPNYLELQHMYQESDEADQGDKDDDQKVSDKKTVKTSTKKRAEFICKECDATLHCLSKYKRHMTTHSGNKNFQCKICFIYYTRKDSLVRHYNSRHPLETITEEAKKTKSSHQCKRCKKDFRYKCHYDRHIEKDTCKHWYGIAHAEYHKPAPEAATKENEALQETCPTPVSVASLAVLENFQHGAYQWPQGFASLE